MHNDTPTPTEELANFTVFDSPKDTPAADKQPPKHATSESVNGLFFFFCFIPALLAVGLSTYLFCKPEPLQRNLVSDVALRRDRELFHELLDLPDSYKPPRNCKELCTAIVGLRAWQRRSEEFNKAFDQYQELTDHESEYMRATGTNYVASISKKKELYFKQLAVDAIRWLYGGKQLPIELSGRDFIDLTRALISVGWANDIKLAELLEERAAFEQSQDATLAVQLRELAQKVRTLTTTY